jgi:hypothetical protein
MARRRRDFNLISMSFLDAITCGFGAVILVFMIINANVHIRRDQTLKTLSQEVGRLQLKVLAGRKNLMRTKDALAAKLEELGTSQGMKQEMAAQIQQTQDKLQSSTAADTERRKQIEQLKADLASLKAETQRLSAASITPQEAGNAIRSVKGEGQRQYLTGLRMGGKHIVMLVDTSTSMLDRTLVNILRRRHMPAAEQRRSPKWRQVVATVNWLTAQIKPGTQFQVIAFNDKARSLIDGSDGKWLTATDGSKLEQAVKTLRGMVPDGPTSLEVAFDAVRKLQPKPDDVYLLTDGLPTMGDVLPSRPGVSSKQRLRFFDHAVRELPADVPVNVILFAMEGDPEAGPAYWTLALRSGGSMMSPSEDWP